MDKCNHYYDGMLAGFMCCRKKGHTGRHMWFLKGVGTRNCFYWTNETNSYLKKYRKAV